MSPEKKRKLDDDLGRFAEAAHRFATWLAESAATGECGCAILASDRGLQALVALLHTTPPTAAIAASAVRDLAAHGSGPAAAKLGRLCLQPLCRLLHHPMTCVEAAEAVCSLAEHDERLSDVMRLDPAVQLLMRQLISGTDTTATERAACCLRILAQASAPREALARSGAVKPLVALLHMVSSATPFDAWSRGAAGAAEALRALTGEAAAGRVVACDQVRLAFRTPLAGPSRWWLCLIVDARAAAPELALTFGACVLAVSSPARDHRRESLAGAPCGRRGPAGGVARCRTDLAPRRERSGRAGQPNVAVRRQSRRCPCGRRHTTAGCPHGWRAGRARCRERSGVHPGAQSGGDDRREGQGGERG